MTIRNALRPDLIFSTSLVIINNKLHLTEENSYNKKWIKSKLKDNFTMETHLKPSCAHCRILIR